MYVVRNFIWIVVDFGAVVNGIRENASGALWYVGIKMDCSDKIYLKAVLLYHLIKSHGSFACVNCNLGCFIPCRAMLPEPLFP